MKAALAALAALCLGSSPAAYNLPDLTHPTPFRTSFDVVPRIRCMGGASGSGVRISDDIVITARHVVNERTCGIGLTAIEPQFLDNDRDFAAMKAPLGGGMRANLSCDGIRAGATYIALGYGLGGSGNVETLVGTNSKLKNDLVRMRGRVYPGMSGGPVFDTEGRVVALVATYYRDVDWAGVVDLSATYLCA